MTDLSLAVGNGVAQGTKPAKAQAQGTAAVVAGGGGGATVIDVHDSTLPTVAYEIASTSAGTLLRADKWGPGGVFGLTAPMSPDAEPFPFVERSRYTLTRPSLVGSVVALPELDGSGPYDRIAQVKYGPFAPQSTLSSLDIPAAKVYLTSVGAAGFLVYDFAARELQLLTASGTRTVSRIPAGAEIEPTYYSAFTASSDGTAAVVSLTGFNYYARLAPPGKKPTEAVELPWANDLVLTPTYVAGWRLNADSTSVGRLRRDAIPASGSAPDWTVLHVDDEPGSSIDKFSATESGIAWTTSNGTGTSRLDTMVMPAEGAPATPVTYERRLSGSGLSPFEGTGDFLFFDAAAPEPGLYRIAPGSATGTFTGTLGTHWSMTHGLAVSHGRAAYCDDTTATYPVFVRDVRNPGEPGPESQVMPVSNGTSPAISGPFIAVGGPISGNSAEVTFGRIGAPLSTVTLPASDVGRLRLSGRRLVVTGGADSWLIDVLTGAKFDLGHVFAAVWGDELATIDYDTALLQRRNLVSGATVTIRPAVDGCPPHGVDEELWCLDLWGTKTVFSYSYGGTEPGQAVGVHDTATGATSPLPMLPSGAYALDHSDDLLLTYGPPLEVRLYDLRTTPAGEALLDGYAERPVALDGHVAAWRPDSDLRAVVQDVRDAFPSYEQSDARYLNGFAPCSFAPAGAPWQPRFLVTRDVDWAVEIRSETGLVRRLAGRSSHGEVVPSWDGRDQEGVPVPSGTYTWTLSGTALDGRPLRNADGTSTVAASGILHPDLIGVLGDEIEALLSARRTPQMRTAAERLRLTVLSLWRLLVLPHRAGVNPEPDPNAGPAVLDPQGRRVKPADLAADVVTALDHLLSLLDDLDGPETMSPPLVLVDGTGSHHGHGSPDGDAHDRAVRRILDARSTAVRLATRLLMALPGTTEAALAGAADC